MTQETTLGELAEERRYNSDAQGINIEGDETHQTIVSKSNTIKTLPEALGAANVDLKVWEVERYIINKWEVGARHREQNLTWDKGTMDGFAKRENRWHVQPLWQVKVWLKRKEPIVTATEELLDQICKNAPLFKHVPPVKSKGGARRSLEVSIMDPHIGLVTHYPEGDGTQDLTRISNTIIASLEDLISKAEVFGPFEEVFMPFGNDFMHVDNIQHTTTKGTAQPEAEAWHRIYVAAETIALQMVERLRKVARVYIYEVPGNHSRMTDFTLARLVKAYFRHDKNVVVDASSSPYKFHRYGVSLIGYEHGHSVAPIRLAALMANERKDDWRETKYREWHLGDQHRKGTSVPATLEEQGVSVEYIPGLTVPNEWHRLKSFNHQKRGAMAFVYDFNTGPIARLQYNIFEPREEANRG